MIIGKRILIAGSAGSIGGELSRQLSQANSVYGLDNNETAQFELYEELKDKGVKTRIGDIRDIETLEDIFLDFKPDTVINAAAYKHVVPMELNPIEAVKTNIIGTNNLVRMCKKFSTPKFIFISTDKVVNGESIMGLTKKIAERIVSNAGYICVRFGNVLNSRGSLIPIWQKQIEKGLPLTVTDKKMERYFMTIPQAVELVIKAIEVGQAGETLCFEMGKKVNIYELAQKVLADAGSEVGIKIIGKSRGETLTEELMNENEKQRATKKGEFYIIKSIA